MVNNLDEGLQAVHLLDDHKKGKANFFLLDKFRDAPDETPAPEGLLRALDVVETDARYRALAGYLLNRVFITDDAEIRK